MLRFLLIVLSFARPGTTSKIIEDEQVRQLVREWAPLVWLAPGEKFLPLGVSEFLDNVIQKEEELHTRVDIESLLRNESSFIYGRDPAAKVPIYALLKDCSLNDDASKKTQSSSSSSSTPGSSTSSVASNADNEVSDGYRRRRKRVTESIKRTDPKRLMGNPKKATLKDDLILELRTNDVPGNGVVTRGDTIRDGNPITGAVNRFRKLHFHVTYWMFYPFSEGKAVCVLDLGFFGSWPMPTVGNVCLGRLKEYGNHVGDWEHMSLYFKGDHPVAMYVSAHDAGAFYRYDLHTGTFIYDGQETRKGIFQKPIFPERVYTRTGTHPILFSARGSHGLWTAPGKHKFVRLPRLYDESGFGMPWPTWKKIELLPDESTDESPAWMTFQGKWGNPRSNCHPLVKLGFNICKFVDGPTGIPTKKGRFRC